MAAAHCRDTRGLRQAARRVESLITADKNSQVFQYVYGALPQRLATPGVAVVSAQPQGATAAVPVVHDIFIPKGYRADVTASYNIVYHTVAPRVPPDKPPAGLFEASPFSITCSTRDPSGEAARDARLRRRPLCRTGRISDTTFATHGSTHVACIPPSDLVYRFQLEWALESGDWNARAPALGGWQIDGTGHDPPGGLAAEREEAGPGDAAPTEVLFELRVHICADWEERE